MEMGLRFSNGSMLASNEDYCLLLMRIWLCLLLMSIIINEDVFINNEHTYILASN